MPCWDCNLDSCHGAGSSSKLGEQQSPHAILELIYEVYTLVVIVLCAATGISYILDPYNVPGGGSTVQGFGLDIAAFPNPLSLTVAGATGAYGAGKVRVQRACRPLRGTLCLPEIKPIPLVAVEVYLERKAEGVV